MSLLVLIIFKSAHLIITENNSFCCLNPMAFLMDPTISEFKLKYPLLKLFEITISDHSSGIKTLHCHFMYKHLNSKSFVSRCKCVGCFDTILVVNPEEWFTHDAAQNSWVLVFRSALCCFLYIVCTIYMFSKGKIKINKNPIFFPNPL